jgi:mannosylglycerate hydrolase MGH1-like protein
MCVCLVVWCTAASARAATVVESPRAVEPAVVLPLSLTRGRVPEGYSVGNFGIAAAIGSDGLSITRSLINPPVLGQWLEFLGKGTLTVTAGGHSDFVVNSRYSVFPENHAELSSAMTGIELHVTTFAPLALKSEERGSFDNFLPAVVIGIEIINHGPKSQSATLQYEFSTVGVHRGRVRYTTVSSTNIVANEAHENFGPAQIWLLGTARAPVAELPSTYATNGNLSRTVAVWLGPGEQTSTAFVMGVFDPRSYTSAKLPSRLLMERYLLEGIDGHEKASVDALNGSRLYRQHTEFIKALPRTGDPSLDVYSRWYLSAAVLLTKGLRSGDIVTMGYRELNQRDSFWTTGAHLVFWPDLELKMLEESMAAQLPNDQIPLTILPTIIRDRNIDGNEYFILRTARYLRWYRDEVFLRQALPHIRRALAYLEALDTDHVGIPKQVSYWADWKDVPGAEGRTYAPYFSLLWLATLKDAKFIATEAGDEVLARTVSALYDKARERVNQDVSEGGLWDRTRYVDRWKDGRKTPYTLQDQVVGAVFDVIPRDRLESLYATLNASSEAPYGVRETYPYIASFQQGNYGPAEYHNGGIWPYLNCIDAWGRYKHHRAADAERIIKEVAYNDLVRNNDFAPGEFLNGDTGKDEGAPIQGWDGACFSAIYFGGFGLDRVNRDDLVVDLNLASARDVSTEIRIPQGSLMLTRENGHVCVDENLDGPLRLLIAGATDCDKQGRTSR